MWTPAGKFGRVFFGILLSVLFYSRASSQISYRLLVFSVVASTRSIAVRRYIGSIEEQMATMDLSAAMGECKIAVNFVNLIVVFFVIHFIV